MADLSGMENEHSEYRSTVLNYVSKFRKLFRWSTPSTCCYQHVLEENKASIFQFFPLCMAWDVVYDLLIICPIIFMLTLLFIILLLALLYLMGRYTSATNKGKLVQSLHGEVVEMIVLDPDIPG